MTTGLLFGSFNPVHVGHLIIASHMCEYGGLQKVLFVLSPQNPFKQENDLLPGEHRLKILEAAVSDDDRFGISTIEFGMPRPSYTIDTLNELSRQQPGEEFVLIMGSDNLESFHLWKQHEEILKRYKIFTYPRSGGGINSFNGHKSVQLFYAPVLDISATFIRESISSGKSPRYLIPDAAVEVIIKNGFYR